MSANAESVRQTEEIPEWKRAEVDEITSFLKEYNSVGVVNITGIPSRQLQLMRRDLHGQAELRVSRNTLLIRALEEEDAGLEQLTDEVAGQVGLIGTNDNPFGLYRKLEASKTSAPINAGDVAPNDIVLDEGDTGIDPGPFVGELQQVGAQARIMEGSIHITEDSTVAETGDEVSTQLANVLSDLGIEPKEVGLDLRSVYSEGILFEPEELALDIDEYRGEVLSGVSAARSLSIEASFPTPSTIGALLGTADRKAHAVAVSAAIEDPSVVPDLVQRADAQVRRVAARIDDEEALPAELIGEAPAQEPATEEPEVDESTTEDEASDEADDDDDDEDDSGAEGLGAMFG